MKHIAFSFKPYVFFILSLSPMLLFSQNNLEKRLLNVEKNVIDSKFSEAKSELDQLLLENKSNDLNKVKIYVSYVDQFSNQNNFEKALYYSNLSKEISDRTTIKLDDAYTNFAFSKIYLINQLYDKTIYYANLSIKNLTDYPNEYLLYSKLYITMSITHSRNGIYSDEYKNYTEKALQYALKSNESLQLVSAYSATTLIYLNKYTKEQNPDDLKLLFQNADLTLKIAEQPNADDIPLKAKIIAYNNFGSLINSFPYNDMSNKERNDLSERYSNKAILLSKNLHNNNILSTCYTTYAEIQENKGNDKLAEEYYLKAYNIVKNEKNEKDIKTINGIVQLLSNFYEKRNNPEEALKYNKEAFKYTQKAYEVTLENKRKFLEAFYNSEQKNREINQLKEKNEIYSKQIYLYIGIVILSIAAVIFLIYLIRYKQKINKQKTDLLESEKNETELTLQLEKEEKARIKAEKDLAEIQQEHSQKQALAASLQLNHKNSFINELKEKVKGDNITNLDRILKDERLADNDFDDMHTIIREVHPNFFKKLNSVSKNKLSNQDLKYDAYIYLNTDNQRIASLLKVEAKTVRMTKYRLKQKIGLEKEDSLTNFIQNLEL